MSSYTLNDLANGSLTFGAKSFFATPHFGGSTSNGGEQTSDAGRSSRANARRPRGTPTAIVIGRHERLRALRHPNLCEPIELIRGKHDRVFLVSEHHRRSLRDVLRAAHANGDSSSHTTPLDEEKLCKYAYQTFDALRYLAEHDVVHRGLHLDNVRVDADDNIKLADYGMYFMSDHGREVIICR